MQTKVDEDNVNTVVSEELFQSHNFINFTLKLQFLNPVIMDLILFMIYSGIRFPTIQVIS